MNEVLAPDVAGDTHSRLRGTVVALFVLAVTAAHWWTPQGGGLSSRDPHLTPETLPYSRRSGGD